MRHTIEEIREKTVPLAKKFGIRKMCLFGSYAKASADDQSDIDLYVDKGNMRNLIQYYSFVQALEEKLGCHVDVVTTDIKDQEFLNRIRKESILLYEQQRSNDY